MKGTQGTTRTLLARIVFFRPIFEVRVPGRRVSTEVSTAHLWSVPGLTTTIHVMASGAATSSADINCIRPPASKPS